ncbi:MAG: nickel-binding protein Mua [Helicobacter sp.]|nr:nickel-binding protein Mua [Helicobacter sp.]
MKDNDLFKKLIDIKDSYEIYELFEEKRAQFELTRNEYEREIKESKLKLMQLRSKIKELNAQKNAILEQKEQLEFEIEDLKTDKVRAKFELPLKKATKEAQEIKIMRDEIMPKKLEKIEVFLEDGTSASLAPLRAVYDESLCQKYRVTLRENREAKHRIEFLELENRQLKIELRDYFSELDLHRSIPQNPKIPSILLKKTQKELKDKRDKKDKEDKK